MGFLIHMLSCGAKIIQESVMALYERWIRVVVIGQKADEKNAINMAQVIRMERDTNKNETKLFFSDGSDIKVKPSMSKLTEDLEDGGL